MPSNNNSEICRRYEIPAIITVQIDTREKLPILFPSTVRISHPERKGAYIVLSVCTERTKLDYGDYRLKQYPNCCVVERKASQQELSKNMTDYEDSIRQAKSFRKLCSCEYPYLLIEASPAEMLKVSDMVKQPDIVLHKLSVSAAKYGLRILWIPWGRTASRRKQLGEIILHLMLGCAVHKNLDILPVLV